MRTVILLSVALLLTSCDFNRAPSVAFGSVDDTGTLTRTSVIEHEIGESYGYTITFPNAQGVVTIKEVFTLPGPAEWESGEPEGLQTPHRHQTLNEDGSQMVSETQFDTSTSPSSFQSGYEIIEGDPKGKHRIEIWIDGEPFEIIDFVLE